MRGSSHLLEIELEEDTEEPNDILEFFIFQVLVQGVLINEPMREFSALFVA